MKHIASSYNPEIKCIVQLHQAKYRKKYNQTFAEGIRAIRTLSQASFIFEALYFTEQNISEAQNLSNNARELILVTSQVMSKISVAKTPSGILALFTIPDQPLPSQLGPGLVLANLTDPGNMGMLIRTAVACNASSIVITPESADPWSPKVIQASAGTIGKARIFQWSWENLLLHKNNLSLCSLAAQATTTICDPITRQSLFVVGSEAHGIPKLWQAQCDTAISLPMPGNIESLNAAVAGSIALYIIHVVSLLCHKTENL